MYCKQNKDTRNLNQTPLAVVSLSQTDISIARGSREGSGSVEIEDEVHDVFLNIFAFCLLDNESKISYISSYFSS